MTSNIAAASRQSGTNKGQSTLRVVVIGGTGLIGTRLVSKLIEHGHDAIAASPATGVNALTGEGLSEVMQGSSVVVDVTNSPSFEDTAVMDFFRKSTRNILAAAADAGVTHHVALSVVGTERLQKSGYFRAKQAQEQLIQDSSLPYSIVHATQFFEFTMSIADAATVQREVKLAPVLFQPIAAEDVASAIGMTATGSPINGTIEIAGPQQFRMDDLVRRALSARHDPREVVADPRATYFGETLEERTLLPGDGARLGATTLREWLRRQGSRK